MSNEESKKQQATDTANILDAIIGAQTASSLTNFQPQDLVSKILSMLRQRDQEIVRLRFGLQTGGEAATLEAIGKKYNLTRERVRQIEKDSLADLGRKKTPEVEAALQLIFDTIVEHGHIISEELLLQTVLVNNKPEIEEQQAIRFLLALGDRFLYHKETNEYWPSWSVVGFSMLQLSEVMHQLIGLLRAGGQALPLIELYSKFKNSDYFRSHSAVLSDKVLKSYLSIAKAIQVNPFSEVGLGDWSEIRPRDVGDKAYVVLKHHGKPEHYSVITQLINDHKFDDRVAYKETVHNELIKDDRFVLIGRGIYALNLWGYKQGVVADVIREILRSAGRPLAREEIITEVLKRRQVKRNTILVGLSNKRIFQKTAKDKYSLVEL